jgi:hypothetical protein
MNNATRPFANIASPLIITAAPKPPAGVPDTIHIPPFLSFLFALFQTAFLFSCLVCIHS